MSMVGASFYRVEPIFTFHSVIKNDRDSSERSHKKRNENNISVRPLFWEFSRLVRRYVAMRVSASVFVRQNKNSKLIKE